MTKRRVDWPLLSSRNTGHLDEVLICLPSVYLDLLLSISDKLRWKATYREFNYDFSDWDYLSSIVAMGEARMYERMSVNQLVEVLEKINQALRTCNDCGGVITRDQKPKSDVEVDVGIPPISTTWPEYRDYLCEAGLLLSDEIAQRLVDLHELQQAGIVGIGTLTSLASAWFSIFIGVVVSEAAILTDFVNDILDNTFFEALSIKFINNNSIRDAVKQAVRCAADAEEAQSNYIQAMDDMVIAGHLDATEAEAAKIIVLEGVFETIFNQEDSEGNSVDTTKYAGATCAGCGDSGSYTFVFDTDEDGFLLTARSAWQAATSTINHHPKSGSSPDPTNMKIQRDSLNVKSGLLAADVTQLDSLTIELTQDTQGGDFMALGKDVVVRVRYEDLTVWDSPPITAYGVHVISGFPIKELQSTAGGNFALEFNFNSNGSNSNGSCNIDNISLTLSIV